MKPISVGRASGQSPAPHPFSAPAHDSGFLSGTIILSKDGEIPIEFLSPGDRIITRGTGMVRLARIRRSRAFIRAIAFAAGSLGHTRPEQDMVLPAGQQLLIRDWRARAMFGQRQSLVRADALVDGEFVCDLGPALQRLHHLHFDQPCVIYAGGLEVAGSTTAACAYQSAA
jgi:Hint domain